MQNVKTIREQQSELTEFVDRMEKVGIVSFPNETDRGHFVTLLTGHIQITTSQVLSFAQRSAAEGWDRVNE